MKRRYILAGMTGLLLPAGVAWGQVNVGQIHLRVTGPAGAPSRAVIEVVSVSNAYDEKIATDEGGSATLRHLPFGVYRVQVTQAGFADAVRTVEVRSAVPVQQVIQLSVAPVLSRVQVSATAVDPDNPSSVMQIGRQQIEQRLSSLPGRSVQDLVNSQPGWLFEGNAVLHPRGSEYQTQFVVNGIPLLDNRSPGFGPEIEAEDLDSVSVYTAGFPAEYGRKLGGVVELNTHRPTSDGSHGQVVLSGGSYATASAFARFEQVWGKNTLGGSGSGSRTDHYLNPVVPQNFTNKGTSGDFSLFFDRDFTDKDRLELSFRHELSRFEIPNELIQEQAGQLQDRDNFETVGTGNYQRTFSSRSIGNLAFMVRDKTNDLVSNPASTPIVAFQHNGFREGYVKATFSLDRGIHQFKAGLDADSTFLRENFSYNITAPDQFDNGTLASLQFADSRPDLEQSAFIEDLVRSGPWTVSAGLRWDHYQLLLNQNAFSPRLSLGRYFASARMVAHVSYDRVYQTPSSENILLSSSTRVDALSSQFLRLPVRPSTGDFFEAGATESVLSKVIVHANVYRRNFRNFADDDQLLNTGVSYPISFRKAIVYGAEGKVEVSDLGRLTGFVSYSYMVGNVWYPVTGGLFLGDDANAAAAQTNGHFPDSQDQRNTARTRFEYRVLPRFSVAGGASYGSGLPFDYAGSPADALAQYGPGVVREINFDRGRILPKLLVNASAAVDVWKDRRVNLRLQADGENLTNRLDLLDFGGLFSGNAIGPARSVMVRLNGSF